MRMRTCIIPTTRIRALVTIKAIPFPESGGGGCCLHWYFSYCFKKCSFEHSPQVTLILSHLYNSFLSHHPKPPSDQLPATSICFPVNKCSNLCGALLFYAKSVCALDITPLKTNALITLWIPYPCGANTTNNACALPSELQWANEKSR